MRALCFSAYTIMGACQGSTPLGGVAIGLLNEAGDCPPQGKGLALAVGVKANNLSRFHTLWVNGSFPLHPSRPCSRATVVAQVQQ